MLEDLIKGLITALNENTTALLIVEHRKPEVKTNAASTSNTPNMPMESLVVVDTLGPKVTPIKKPKVIPDPNPVIGWNQVYRAVCKWMEPLAAKDKPKARKVMQKMLDKFTGGEMMDEKSLAKDDYPAVMEYIKKTKAE